eukprot:Rhum_TRINITY_DN8504_c0_g1::Rhum_TRINITY_DN8504_c0_g1_i1::g.28418::m.28418
MVSRTAALSSGDVVVCTDDVVGADACDGAVASSMEAAEKWLVLCQPRIARRWQIDDLSDARVGDTVVLTQDMKFMSGTSVRAGAEAKVVPPSFQAGDTVRVTGDVPATRTGVLAPFADNAVGCVVVGAAAAAAAAADPLRLVVYPDGSEREVSESQLRATKVLVHCAEGRNTFEIDEGDTCRTGRPLVVDVYSPATGTLRSEVDVASLARYPASAASPPFRGVAHRRGVVRENCRTVAEILEESFRVFAEFPCVLDTSGPDGFEGAWASFAQVEHWAGAVRSRLPAAGARVVLATCSGGLAHIVTYTACLLHRVVLSVLPSNLDAVAIAGVVEDTAPAVIFVDPDAEPTWLAAAGAGTSVIPLSDVASWIAAAGNPPVPDWVPAVPRPALPQPARESPVCEALKGATALEGATAVLAIAGVCDDGRTVAWWGLGQPKKGDVREVYVEAEGDCLRLLEVGGEDEEEVVVAVLTRSSGDADVFESEEMSLRVLRQEKEGEEGGRSTGYSLVRDPCGNCGRTQWAFGSTVGCGVIPLTCRVCACGVGGGDAKGCLVCGIATCAACVADQAGAVAIPMAEAAARARGGDDAAMILYTSGSTGRPKGAVVSERAMFNDVWLGLATTPTDIVKVLSPPLSTSSVPTLLLASLSCGGRVGLSCDLDEATAAGGIGPTAVGFVPAEVAALMERHLASPEQDLDALRRSLGPRVRRINSGGAATPEAVMSWLRASFPHCLVSENYGLTEGGCITFNNRLCEGVEYKLVDWDGYTMSDKPLPRGELCVKTKVMATKYLNRPDVTAEAFDSDGYYHTGDIVSVDISGLTDREVARPIIKVIDRKKEIFKLHNGEFVAPLGIETDLCSSVHIQQAFVWATSSDSSVVALVVPSEAHPLPSVTAYNEECRRVCSARRRHEVPGAVGIVPAFTQANGLLTRTLKPSRQAIRTTHAVLLDTLRAAARSARLDECGGAAEAVVRLLRTYLRCGDAACDAASAPAASAEDAQEWERLSLRSDSIACVQTAHAVKRELGVVVHPGTLLTSDTLDALLDAIRASNSSGAAAAAAAPGTVSAAASKALLAVADDLAAWAPPKAAAAAAASAAASAASGGGAKVETEGEEVEVSRLPRRTRPVVMVTGASGFLGAAVVHKLLASSGEEGVRVVALVRSKERLEEALKGRGYRGPLPEVAVGDVAAPRLGLEAAAYARLEAEVSAVVNCAATVNFLAPYSAAREANVVGTGRLLAFCAGGSPKKLVHVSTDGVAKGGSAVYRAAEDCAVWAGGSSGYNLSKAAAECLVEQAHAGGGDVCIVRPGMVGADAETGACNVRDWVIRYVAGCVQLHACCTAPATAANPLRLTCVGYCADVLAALAVADSPADVTWFNEREAGCAPCLRLPAVDLAMRDLHAALRSAGVGDVRGVTGAEWDALLASLPPYNAMFPLKDVYAGGLTPAPEPCGARPPTIHGVAREPPAYDETVLHRAVQWLVDQGEC